MKGEIMVSLILFNFSLLFAGALENRLIDCDAGDAQACLDAGKQYSAQTHQTKSYSKEAVASKVASFYKKSCTLGNAEGCTAYAMQYTSDTNKDPNKDATYYFKKGCESGDKKACTLLKMMQFTQK